MLYSSKKRRQRFGVRQAIELLSSYLVSPSQRKQVHLAANGSAAAPGHRRSGRLAPSDARSAHPLRSSWLELFLGACRRVRQHGLQDEG